MKKLKDFIIRIMIFMIKTYQQTLSPRFSGGACRFTPTCSQYAIEALREHGIIKGSLLAIWRIMRCNPFCKGGYDPVPLKKSKQEEKNNQ